MSSIASFNDLARGLIRHHADPLGHLLGLLSGARPRFVRGCFVYVSSGGLARLVLTRRGYSAITLGQVLVATAEPTPLMWRHELHHVAQYERFGCAFLPLYLLLYSRHGYGAHPLEQDAVHAARAEEREYPR